MVRIAKNKNIFTKGYEANSTKELLKITTMIRGDPIVYELVDREGEEIHKRRLHSRKRLGYDSSKAFLKKFTAVGQN